MIFNGVDKNIKVIYMNPNNILQDTNSKTAHDILLENRDEFD